MFNRIILILTVLLGLAGCARQIPVYRGPAITSIVVSKSDRKLYLMHDRESVREFDIELGFTPEGHKQFEGDGKTPEGVYYINRRNPRSQYHLSLGVSYPNNQDRAFAQSQGRSPGGDIFIHGTPRGSEGVDDWTAGCIAVTNKEIEQIWVMVKDGTPIFVYP